MKQVRVVCYLLALLFLAFSARAFLKANKVEFSFSPVSTNPTNVIDIRSVSLDNYQHVVEESDAVFITKDNSQKQVHFNDKQLRSFILSPSHNQVAFTYYPDEPEDQVLSVVLLDVGTRSTEEIFHTIFPSWDVTSNPQWLGNDHLFFLRHCGTACQGLTLLDNETGKTKNAVLSYPSFPDQPEITYLTDWLGNEYKMNGLVGRVMSETENSKSYLIFSLENKDGEQIGQKRILFSSPQKIL